MGVALMAVEHVRKALASSLEAVELPPEILHGEIELTEDGIARAFVERHGDRVRYDHEVGAWFVWDRDHWRQDRTGLAFEFCRRLAREASTAAKPGDIRTARRAATAAGVERMARSDQRVAVTADAWDGDPMLLGSPGVTIDLRSGASRSPDPGDGITKRVAVTPQDGPCPAWIGFLLWAVGGDEDVLRFVQVFVGYLLTGQTQEHVLVFVHGPGGNGKSVFLNILARLLGDYAATAAMDTFTASRTERHSTDLAMLRGARLVTASETAEGRAWDEAKVKQLTGGDRITARFMRQDNFTFLPNFKLLIAGNHQPTLRTVDPAIRRRFLVLPFTRTPERPDPDLEERIWQEAPQILAWAIRGALEWQEEGLPRPAAVMAATDQYLSDQDTFSDWVASCCRLVAGEVEKPADLFRSWKTFAEAAGERPGTAKALGAKLRRLGLENTRASIAGRQHRVWSGIRLTDAGTS